MRPVALRAPFRRMRQLQHSARRPVSAVTLLCRALPWQPAAGQPVRWCAVCVKDSMPHRGLGVDRSLIIFYCLATSLGGGMVRTIELVESEVSRRTRWHFVVLRDDDLVALGECSDSGNPDALA